MGLEICQGLWMLRPPPDIELTLKFGGKEYSVKDQGKSANGQIKGRR